MAEGLLLIFLDFNGFKIFGLEDLTAVQAFDVIHAVSAGDHLGPGMVTSGVHNQQIDEIYSNHVQEVVKSPAVPGGYSPDWYLPVQDEVTASKQRSR